MQETKHIYTEAVFEYGTELTQEHKMSDFTRAGYIKNGEAIEVNVSTDDPTLYRLVANAKDLLGNDIPGINPEYKRAIYELLGATIGCSTENVQLLIEAGY